MSAATRHLLRPALQTATRSALPLSTAARLTLARSFHSTLPKMTVHNVESVDAFKEAIAKHPVVVVDWFATWCGPCKMIAPQLAKWSNEFPQVHFVKVDVDAIPELSAEYEIRAMPTFTVIKDGQKAEDFTGAVPPKVLDLIKKHAPEGEAKTEEAKAE